MNHLHLSFIIKMIQYLCYSDDVVDDNENEWLLVRNKVYLILE